MSNASTVAIVEEEPKVRNIPSASTSVAGAVGEAPQGPVNTPVLCTSFDEYQETFGDFSGPSSLALAVKGFFENGGRRIWVSRVSASVSPGVAASATYTAPGWSATYASLRGTIEFPMEFANGDQITVQCATGTFTATFEGAPASIAGQFHYEPYTLVDGQTLTLNPDGNPQTMTFTASQFADISAATAQEVADAINAAIPTVVASAPGDSTIHIDTFSQGTHSSLSVLGGTVVESPATPATMTSTEAGPFTITDGDFFYVYANGHTYGFQFQGQPAVVQDSIGVISTQPFALADGKTLLLQVDGGTTQTVTFHTSDFGNIGAATAVEVCNAINAQITGAQAFSVSNAVRIKTLSAGTASTLQVMGGTAVEGGEAINDGTVSEPFDFGSGATLNVIVYPIAPPIVMTFSSSNVPNIHAVTIADVAAVAAAAGGTPHFSVINNDGKLRIKTTYSGSNISLLVFNSAALIMGCDPNTNSGSNADAFGLAGMSGTGTGNVANIAAVTRTEVIDLLNANFAYFDLTMDDVGTGILLTTLQTGSYVTLQADGQARSILGFDAAIHRGTDQDPLGLAGQSAVGSGNVANLRAITGFDAVTVTQAAATFSDYTINDALNILNVDSAFPGSGAFLQATGAAATKMGVAPDLVQGIDASPTPEVVALRADALASGVDGNALQVNVTFPTSGAPDTFDVLISQLVGAGLVQVEAYADLTRDPSSPRFVETIVNDPVNGSDYVRMTNLPNTRTAAPTFAARFLTGGVDGTAGITDTDFVGDEAAATGLYALDSVQDLSILIVPGRASPEVHAGMLAYCEQHRDGSVFAVLDPPAGMRADAIVTYVTDTAALLGASEYGALYWPRVTVANPDKSVLGPDDTIVVPPSGIVAGVYARVDGSRPGGVYEPPAGVDVGRMFGVLGFEHDDSLKPRMRDVVYPSRINPLTTAPGRPRFIDGSRTLKGDGLFPFVASRRGVQFISESLKNGLEFARYKSNTPELRAQVRRTITAFLLTQMYNGAFQSRDPDTAFYVDISDALNPPSVVAAGKLVARIGLAITRPAEFIVLEISQDTRALEEEIAG